MIRPLLFILLLLVALTGCRESNGDTTAAPEAASPAAAFGGLEIDRKFDYSDRFLEALVRSGVDSAVLRKGVLILDSASAYPFPPDPGVFEMTAIFGETEDLHMKVILERLNYSTISYSLLAGHGHDLSVVREGAVHLRPDFYKTESTEISTISGIPYRYDEYIQADTAGCSLILRLGREEGENRMSGRIFRLCGGKEVQLVTEVPVTLQEK